MGNIYLDDVVITAGVPVPMPGSWHGPDTLAESLYQSSRRHAHTALAHYTRDDERHVDAAFHCGAAIEHLAKAYLASLHPTLIAAERANFDSLLVLTGNAHRAKKSHGVHLRTIGLRDACKRLTDLIPSFSLGLGLDELENTRNAAAHLGLTNAGEVRQAARAMVRLAGPVLAALDRDTSRYWHGFDDLVGVLRDEAIAELDRIVAVKLAAAREVLRQKLAGCADAEKAIMLRAMAGRIRWEADYQRPQVCPVCKQAGTLHCFFDIDETDTRPGPADGRPMPRVHAVVNEFYCSVCELALDNAGETDAAGLPEEFDLGYRPLDPEFEWPIVEPAG